MYTLPLNFFFEPALSVISLTPTVFTNKISVALKAIRQCSHRQTDFGHNFGWSRWTSWYFPGWSLSGFKNETSRLLTYKIFWWKKLHHPKVPRERHGVKVGAGPRDFETRDPGSPSMFKSGTRNPLQSLKVWPPHLSLMNSFFSEHFMFCFYLFNFFVFFK